VLTKTTRFSLTGREVGAHAYDLLAVVLAAVLSCYQVLTLKETNRQSDRSHSAVVDVVWRGRLAQVVTLEVGDAAQGAGGVVAAGAVPKLKCLGARSLTDKGLAPTGRAAPAGKGCALLGQLGYQEKPCGW